jgi:membrane protein implicated in regulation of membrane protease activity
VILLVSIALAIFVLPPPWGLVAVVVGATIEIAETGLFLWWSQRRRASVGIESLEGTQGVAVSDVRPEGQVKVRGEIWRARCEGGIDRGVRVVVREVDGLTLVVEPVDG